MEVIKVALWLCYMQERCYKIPIIRILIEVQLIYNDVLVSGVQQNDSDIGIYNICIYQDSFAV